MLNPELTKRFSDCAWFQPRDISVIGLGGVGRGVAETLFLAGHNVTVWDEDVVEPVNGIPQGYQAKYVGFKKADAFKVQMAEFVGDTSNLITFNKNWNKNCNLNSIVIAAADNWQTLSDLYERWREFGDLFISPGMLADMYNIRVYMKDDGLDWVGGDENEESVPCTTKSSMYMAKACHGIVVSIVNKFIINPQLIDHVYRFDGLLD